MYSRFRRLLLMVMGMLATASSFGQYQPVQVTFSVIPPITPKIYNDYEKLSAALISSEQVECFVRASIEGDNGISFFTEPGFKPSIPINLLPGQPYVLNSENWQQAVNLDHVTIQGITEPELLQNGIPPGNYTFCLMVFDFMTGQPLSAPSPAGCTSFIVSILAPPEIVNCMGEMPFPTPEYSNPVVWITDPAAPLNATFVFSGKKVPIGMGAAEAWNSPAVPLLFEKPVMEKVYMLKGSDLGDISAGNEFVFAVQMIDPLHIFMIQNDGWSIPCTFIIGKGDTLMHKVETSETWPPGHILPASPGWPPEGGHKERISKDWPPDHKDEISKTWPEGHLAKASKTWGDNHKEELSKTWPANHEAGWSNTWPKGHTAEKSPTWPSNHHGDITKNWVNHDASRSPTWPANHTKKQSDTWGDHDKATSESWKANHDGTVSKEWKTRDHKLDISKSWPANHDIDNSNGWVDNPNHNAVKSPTWPPNHIASQSKNYVNHTIDRSQQWSAGHNQTTSNKWPDPKDHSQARSLSWPANHKVERSSLYARDHKIDRSHRWPANHKVKTSENIP
jgi:hypothetical protein